MVGEIIIKTKLALEQFEKDFDKLVEESKEKGKKAGETLSKAFNKAVNIGKGLLSVVGKIGLGFGKILFSAGAIGGLLGVASIGALSLSNAIKKVVEDNDQLKANIQYIVFALTKALEPVINAIANVLVKIINLLFQAVQYTAYLVKAWTGKNIFAGAGVDAFAQYMEDAEKSSKKTAKNAKEINKQLAGFDEMSILNDSSSAGGSASGGGAGNMTLPSFDLSQGDMEPPKWMVWIKDNWKIIAFGIGAIGTALLLLKLGLTPLKSLLGGLITAQVVSILIGMAKQLKRIIEFIQDPSWDKFLDLITEGFWDTQGLLGILVDTIVDNFFGGWDNVKEELKKFPQWLYDNLFKQDFEWADKWGELFGDVGKWFEENIGKPISDTFQNVWDRITEIFSPAIDFFSEIFGTVTENIGIMRDNIVTIASFIWEKVKEVFGVVSQWVEDNIVTPVKEKIDGIRKSIEERIDKIKQKAKELKEDFINRFLEAKKKIEEIFNPLVNFFGGLWDKIKTKLKEIGTKIGETVGGAFKKVINGIIGAIENTLNTPIKAINGLIGIVGKVVPGLSKLNTFSFPRLAKGGIINMPGNGVMVGSAIAGESGREGVIPLTDSQQMALLGEAIGKYITVNNVNPIYLNGRQIAREVNISNNESDFAFNR